MEVKTLMEVMNLIENIVHLLKETEITQYAIFVI